MDLLPASLANYTLECYLTRISRESRIIYWIIIGTILAVIILLPFIYVDVSVRARGYFQSDIERQIISSPFQGKIVYTSVHKGGQVEKGDTLLVIESESLKAQQESLLQRIEDNDASIRDLELLTAIDSVDLSVYKAEFRTRRYQAEFRNFRSQHSIQQVRYEKKKTEHHRNELLFSQRIIPDADYENSLFILGAERDNLEQLLFNQKSMWQSDLSGRKVESVRLYADLKHCREELINRIIVAPTGGNIIQSADIQKGSLVITGQKIAEISPEGELVATCFVRPEDIGFINERQKVRIQVDAFNYHEWGMLQCEIIDISGDMIVNDGSSAYFRVRCRPSRECLSMRNGKTACIKKGMSFNARIVLIRRSLYHLLADKSDKWFNPYMSVKK